MNKPPLLILMPMLGNNRTVINGTTGAVEQTVAYYPFGGVIADLGTPAGGQPYKFGGKELLTANGLNEYDFGARRYYPAVPHFTSIDPLCEKYYPLSPYLYCGNDPVNAIDPTGKDIWTLDSEGRLIDSQSFDMFDLILVYDKNNILKGSWKGDYGSITNQSSRESKTGTAYSVYEAKNDDIGTSVFEFLAQNTSVEWSQLKTGFDQNGNNYITSSHFPNKEYSAQPFIEDNLSGINIRSDIHNHPCGSEFPSGMDSGPNWSGDIGNAKWLETYAPAPPEFLIYNPLKNRYVKYTSRSTKFEFQMFFENLPEFIITISKNR